MLKSRNTRCVLCCVSTVCFSERLGVVVGRLLSLGPDRLPHAAKTAGLWVRKIRRSINSVQREINAQLDHEELQQKISETNQRILKEGQAIQNTITPYPEEYQPENDTEPTQSTLSSDHKIQDEVSAMASDEEIPLSSQEKSEPTEPQIIDVEKTPEARSRT